MAESYNTNLLMKVPFLQKIFNPMHNCEMVVNQICKLHNVSVTRSSIKKDIEEHPDFASLLSVSDVLNNFGVETLSIKISIEQLKELPTPFIAQVKRKQELFTVIKEINGSNINLLNPDTLKAETTDFKTFESQFTGVVLLVEARENAGEKDYRKHLREEKIKMLTNLLTVTAIPIFTLLICFLIFFKYGTASIAAIIYTLITLAGTLVGTLLLWYEVDQHYPALQKICSAGKKINCGAILHSKASKIFGISWIVIGFTYFAGSLLSLLVTGIYNLPVLFVLSWMNIIALPYIIFSIYYQARIAKQWCVMCLAVQVILGLQFIVALFGGLYMSPVEAITSFNILTIAVCFIIPFLVISLLLPALRKAKESKENKIALQRLKHNPQIFEALLAKQKIITESTDGLGITIGNYDAKYKLIKACNPYCGPCAKAHPVIEELIHNNPDVQVQIIFNVTCKEGDVLTPPVKHLLAIAEKGDEERTKQALDDWYLAEKKDYAVFASKYPLNGELKLQGDKIKAMREWCDKTGISFTPTFFVNGYQLPEIYSVADLKYFLSV
ncbi:MAG TPA: cysteine peptidase family C39 domain-containing protein [Hanamia sp.]